MTYTVTPVAGYNATPPPDDGSHVASNVPKWADVKTKLADPVKDAIDTNLADIAAEFGTTAAAIADLLANSQLDLTIATATDKFTIRIPGIKWQVSGVKVTTGSINNAHGNIYRSAEVGVTWLNGFNITPFVFHQVFQGSDSAWSALGSTSIGASTGSVRGMAGVSTSTALISVVGIGSYT